jgi:hypothetical protein
VCATIDDVLDFICAELGLHSGANERVEKLRLFSAYLGTLMRDGGTGVLFVDEAHHLNDEVLGGLRMLAPLDRQGERILLQIVLVGQPELERRLAEPNLRPINQRIALRCRLTCLRGDEVAAYIFHRLQTVGHGQCGLFDAEAVHHVALASRGIPRLINSICDNALLLAYHAGRNTVSAQLIDEAVTNLRIGEPVVPPSFAAQEAPPPDSGEIPVTRRTPTISVSPVSSPPEDRVITAMPGRRWGYVLAGILPALGVVLVVQRHRLPFLSTPPPPALEITRVTPAEDKGPPILPVNRAPQIVTVAPQSQSVRLAAGATQQFTVSLTDPDTGQSIEALWFLDGKKVAQGPEWTFAPPPGASAGEHSLTMTATDAEGAAVEQRWVVTVTRDVPPPPRITRTQPANSDVAIAEGQRVTFAVDVANPHADVRYAWLVDGEERAQGPRWTYQPRFTDGGQTKTITVQVKHPDTQAEERHWTVAVQNVNRPPAITSAEPKTQEVKIERGKGQRFVVSMLDPDQGDRLTAVWLLNGKKVARGRTWTFPPTHDDVRARHVVSVTVADQHGMKTQKRWRVSVTESVLPPLPFVDVQPAMKELAATAEQPVTFAAAVAAMPTGVEYVWLLDGKEESREPRWTYRPPAGEGGEQKTVTLRVSHPGHQSVEHNWKLRIQAMVPPPVAEVPAPSPLHEAEVRAWVEAQRRALEERNADTLAELGALISPEREREQEILSRYNSFGVTFRDIAIHIEGSRAEVSFSRVDTIEGTEVMHPERERFILHKDESGRIQAQPQ